MPDIGEYRVNDLTQEWEIYTYEGWTSYLTANNISCPLTSDVFDISYKNIDQNHLLLSDGTTGPSIIIKQDGFYRQDADKEECICTWDQLRALTYGNKDDLTKEAANIAKELVMSQDFMKQAIAEAVNQILNTNDLEVLNAIEQKIKRIKAKRFLAILEEG